MIGPKSESISELGYLPVMASETSVSPQDTAPGPGPSAPNTDIGTPFGGYFGMARRRRVVGNWVEHHGFCVDRVSAARMDRRPRHRIDSRGGRGVARVCGMGAPRALPRAAVEPVRKPKFGRCQSDNGIRYGGLDGLTLDHALCPRGGGLFSYRGGLSTLPSPIVSFLFARRVGGLAARIGPRVFVIAGPVLAGTGYLLIRPAAHGFHLVTDLLPGMIV